MKDYLIKDNMFIASRTNAYINRAIVSILDKPDRHTTSATIRCIYAFIAYRLFANSSISESIYRSKILGQKTIQMSLSIIIIEFMYLESKLEKKKQLKHDRRELAKKNKEIALLKNEIAS